MRYGSLAAVLLISAAPASLGFAADRSSKKDAKTDNVPCALSAKEMKAHALVDVFLKSKGRYKLVRKSGCLGDESGRELPAVLLALPEYSEPYAVRIAAAVIKASYVLPRITLLDDTYTATRTIDSEQIKRRGGEMST